MFSRSGLSQNRFSQTSFFLYRHRPAPGLFVDPAGLIKRVGYIYKVYVRQL
ncbi:hypothetical protein HMPREF0201_03380 [Cedecea davisae DSM 4568]|uniref:Uncharacterized protein n=1 Tax=Cedecea davisae DSM 4568 TaxID=566551 RepID=S3JQ99_9ENTR|nr:hypothetical protein HMPREF0201_03380 [Cedecea davisae DSM 4568]